MKVLLTGAFGNVGTSTLKELIKSENEITAFDLSNKRNRRTAKKLAKIGDFKTIWGDLTNYSDVLMAVAGQDVIIHLGAIIPPLANDKPHLAEAVNVGGTKNILAAMKAVAKKAKIIFSSSVAIYGDVRDKGLDYIIKTTDKINPSPHDYYARTKVKCEELIKQSGLTYAIFRFAAIPPFDQGPDPLMFEVPLDTPIELCHTLDTGLAMARAIESKEVWGKTLHIGGGPSCRVPYSEYAGRLLDEMGIGRLPEEAFSVKPFHCGYMDTKESQRILKYQRHSYEDYLKGVKKRYQFLKPLIVLFKSLIRKQLLKKSSYYIAYKKSIAEYMQSKKKKRKTQKHPSKKKTPSKTRN